LVPVSGQISTVSPFTIDDLSPASSELLEEAELPDVKLAYVSEWFIVGGGIDDDLISLFTKAVRTSSGKEAQASRIEAGSFALDFTRLASSLR